MTPIVGARVCASTMAFLLALATGATAAETFNQEAPIAPYAIPTDPAQAAGDKAATGTDNGVAPLPALPPEPVPPRFKDVTKGPAK